MKLQALLLTLALSLQGCAGTLGAIGALSSAATPKVSADLQVGDRKTDVTGTTLGAVTSAQNQSKIKTVKASQKAVVDQSQSKVDKTTEVGPVTGNVMVSQGPDKMTLVLLSLGWPLFVLFLIWAVVRRVKNVRSNSGASAPSGEGTSGTSEVLGDEEVQPVRLAEDVHL